ncbi:MAG: benzoyl-CoA reductase subunit B [Vicinamibacterales bacterium]|nr:benzoyl-CoA reductase subunit B [Planctomycetota bacterium]MDP7338943.1 benzoyl-CoA reductase subunit B [Vicinamibacterales bacterium]MDP7480343.1 benzoyl-CoA reductase subunit B [Vicinamibacterales bacterium]
MTETVPTQRDASMALQKKILAEHYHALAQAPETGAKTAYTFVPGNLTELIRSFDMLPVLPEINALQSGMRKQSGDFVREAEKLGHSEDVCTYVKCDIGMLKGGNIGPTGEHLPDPDILLLSYTGCFTFMKWFELLKQEYDCEIVMLHVPYQGGGEITQEMVDYIVRQLEEQVIPKLEKVTGKTFDADAVSERLALSAQAEDDFVYVLESAKHRPSPIDGYFGGVFYIGPIFSAFRGTQAGIDYYRALRSEVDARIAAGKGPVTPAGEVTNEQYRLVVEGPPNWTHFREFWKMFYEENAVCVASTYTKVGGLYDRGFRHDPSNPLESLARYCLGCYTNLNLPQRVDLICDYVREYSADGFLINSVKSCNSFSAGQLVILREVEERTGVPGGFIESDLVDPRYFSAANIKNRLESYLQMIEQRRQPVGATG